MEIKEGMYVRYKNFGKCEKIAKIKGIEPPDDNFDFTYYTFNDIQGTIENCIIKVSYDIIDLIQEGDYVNRCRVCGVDNGKIYTKVFDFEGYKEPTQVIFTKKEIKSVVTKEQFKQMEYEVK